MDKNLIGTGSYGNVKLGTHLKTNKTYAIKSIQKSSKDKDNNLFVQELKVL